MSDTAAEMLKDRINDMERNAYDGIDFRQDATAAYALADELGNECDQLKDENAKLRELVQDMYACISYANEQYWLDFERDKLGCGMSCTVNGESCGLCVLADRMRELGVDE